MSEMQFIWKNGQMIPWQAAKTHVLTHSLHYGSGVFEGLRLYQTQKGPAIMKLKEHVARFFYSAEQVGMKIAYSEETLCQAIVETVKQNQLQEGYIRPFAYYGYGSMKVVPVPELPVDVVIACWPWSHYLSDSAVDIATSPYIRIHPKSTVADAKISGHYVNSLLAGLLVRDTHYHEALMLDAEGFVAEGSAENLFIVKDGRLLTTPPGTILVGITRQVVIDMAKKMGIPVEETLFKPAEVLAADEAFFTGTAVEITPVRSLDDQAIGEGNVGPMTEKIKAAYHKITHGEWPEEEDALTLVRAKER